VSGGEEKIGQLFSEAENNSPSVICFDEVDAIMPKRDGDSNPAIKARVNEFLAQINKCSERGIFIIATTNKPNIIDSAMLRTGRLEIQLYVPPPDIIAREKLFELYLKNRYCEVEIKCKELAKLTEGIVASDVEFIVNQSSHKAAMLDVRISMDIIKGVLSSFTPSVSKDDIDIFKQEHLNFINSDESTGRRSIGY
jgi:transitional endoplasmic reticulum ATPase